MQSSQAKPLQPTTTSNGTITVPLRDIAQLLDPDPAPFRQGIVTPEAEDYILRAAKKLPGNEPIRIVVDLPGGTEPYAPADIADKISGHFRSAAEEETRDVRELFRYGRKALLIGVLTLSACLFLAWFFYEKLPQRPDHPADAGKFRDPRLGLNVAADRDLSLRLAAACQAAEAVRSPLGCGGGRRGEASWKALSARADVDRTLGLGSEPPSRCFCRLLGLKELVH